MNAFLKKQNLKLPLQSTKRFSITSGKKIIIGIISLIILVVILNIFSQQIRNTFYTITTPLSTVFVKAGNGTGNFLYPFFHIQGLAQENLQLKAENQNLLSKITSLQQTLKGNQSLQSVIQNTKNDNITVVLAQPIGLDTVADAMLIDKGSANGIAENMPVISNNKVLLGKVFKVYKNFSQIMLISNVNSVVDAKIQNDDPTQLAILGAVKGKGNLSLYLDLVSSDAQINPGNVLITSGLEGIFPKNLLIGKIISKNQSDLKPFQTADIQSFFDIHTIDTVFVITNYMKK